MQALQTWLHSMLQLQATLHAGPKDMAARHFATAGYFAPGRDITMADHMLDVVIRAEGDEVAELITLYKDSQVSADDRTYIDEMASSSDADPHR